MAPSETDSVVQNNQKRTASKTRRIGAGIFWIVVACAAGAAMFALKNQPALQDANASRTAAAEDPTTSSPDPLPVNTIQVYLESDVTQTQSYTGTIRARQSSELAFEIPGTIIEISVSEGESVAKGQSLARLDTRTLHAQRAAVVAQLAQANAVLDEMNVGPRTERIRSAIEQVNARDSDFRLARLNRDRRLSLHKAGAVSDEELDRAEFAVTSAEANLKDAKQRLAELEAGTRKEQLAAQASAVRGLESSLEEIDVALAKSQLLAPFSGTISQRYADNGSVASASAPVFRLIESGKLEAVIGLPPDVTASVVAAGTNSPVTLHVGDRTISASIRSRVRELDPVTRTQNILLDIESADTDLVVPGELCEWRIEQPVNRSGYWLPASALTRGVRGLWSVMAVIDQNDHCLAEKRDIEILLTESDRVLARGLLSDGERVIVDGLHRIAAGQRVIDAGQAASAEKASSIR